MTDAQECYFNTAWEAFGVLERFPSTRSVLSWLQLRLALFRQYWRTSTTRSGVACFALLARLRDADTQNATSGWKTL